MSFNVEKHYHSKADGCLIKKTQKIFGGQGHSDKYDWYCETHNVAICRCGYEWYFHYGTDTRKLDCRNYNNNEIQKEKL